MDDSTRSLLISAGLTIFSSILSAGAALYWFRRNAAVKAAAEIAAEHQKLLARVAELEASNRLLAASVVPISTAFQAVLIKQLTHDGTPEMDDLLVKIGPPYTLSHDEERRLVTMLEERTELEGTMMTDLERKAALMLPYVIQRVQAEAALGVPEMAAAAVGAASVAEKKSEEKAAPVPVIVENQKSIAVKETP